MDSILQMKNITKNFPGVKALDDVSFDLKKGEIHALMGENGAGKSTLVKIISGVYQQDEGEIFLDGVNVAVSSPIHARKLGISTVHQHVTCYPDLSITENIFMGHEILSQKTRQYDWKRMNNLAAQHLKKLGVSADPRMPMSALSIAQQQIVEIAKAVSTNARILIMDEPTAALSKTECDELYEITRELVKEGTSVILISHRTEDIFSLADRVSVFRDARSVGTWDIGNITLQELTKAMVGRELSQIYPPKQNEIGDELFEVKGLSKKGYFQEISFNVRHGEIVALTGLVGAGRTEVCQTIFGILSPDSGSILVQGQPVQINSPSSAKRSGIAYLPEDRQSQGLIMKWGVDKNISLSNLPAFTSQKVFLRRNLETQMAEKMIRKLSIKAQWPDDIAESLSGGNQQKTVIAKTLTGNVKLLILDEPTKGVDVGAKEQIYHIMRDLAKEGYGILLVSSEMNEVLGMSDRIYVMRNGRIISCLTKNEATSERILADAIQIKASEVQKVC